MIARAGAFSKDNIQKNQVCAEFFANVAFSLPDYLSVIFTSRNFLPNIRF